LFEVAEQIPGVKVLGTVTDPAGNAGVGVGRVSDDGVEQRYIFDPKTSALLGEETVTTRAGAGGPGVAAGALLGWASYISSGIVDSLSATPTGTVSPPSPAIREPAPAHGSARGAPTAASS
jgi:hypothetical protein